MKIKLMLIKNGKKSGPGKQLPDKAANQPHPDPACARRRCEIHRIGIKALIAGAALRQ